MTVERYKINHREAPKAKITVFGSETRSSMEPALYTLVQNMNCDACQKHCRESKREEAGVSNLRVASKTALALDRKMNCKHGWCTRTVSTYYLHRCRLTNIYSYLYYLFLISVCILHCESRPLGGQGDGVKEHHIVKRSSDTTPRPISGTDYLASFGYLPASDLETGALRTQEEVAAALRSFQHFAHIPETGEFDAATLAKMNDDRCGVPDPTITERNRRRSKRYVLGPSHWDKNELTWGLVNYTPDLDYSRIMYSLQQAFTLWSEVTNLDFRQSYYPRDADMRISFDRDFHGDGSPFDGPGRVLAHAFYPGNGAIDGDLHFDDDEVWTFESYQGTNLFIVAAHEMGHALGLGHSETQGSLMYPWYQGYVENFALHSDDIAAIRQLYGFRDNRWRPETVRPGPPPTQPMTLPTTTTTTRRPPDGKPDTCTTSIDAISQIRSELFAFTGKWYWRIVNERQHSGKISEFWTALPRNLEGIDAIYERTTSDGYITVFKDDRYWLLATNTEREVGFPYYGHPLTRLGLPADVRKIDAAFIWGKNRKTYLISGDRYWRMDDHTGRVESGYPRGMSVWKNVPLPVDSALTYNDGHTYFFHGAWYTKLDNYKVEAESKGYPKRIAKAWLECSMSLTELEGSAQSTTSNRHLLLFVVIIAALIAK